MDLQTLRKKMELIKSDFSKKEGEKTAVMTDLQNEFAITTLDEAYDKYDLLKEEKKSKQEEKDRLIISIEERLKAYGY